MTLLTAELGGEGTIESEQVGAGSRKSELVESMGAQWAGELGSMTLCPGLCPLPRGEVLSKGILGLFHLQGQ